MQKNKKEFGSEDIRMPKIERKIKFVEIWRYVWNLQNDYSL